MDGVRMIEKRIHNLHSPVLKAKSCSLTSEIIRWTLRKRFSKEPQKAKNGSPSVFVLQTRSSWATSNAAIVDVTDPKSQKPLVLSNDIDMSHVTNVKDVLAASFIFPRQCSPKNVKVLLPLRNNNRPKTRLHCTVKFVWPTLVWSKLKQYGEVRSRFKCWNFGCGTMCGSVHQSGEDASIRIVLSFLSQIRHALLYLRLDF